MSKVRLELEHQQAERTRIAYVTFPLMDCVGWTMMCASCSQETGGRCDGEVRRGASATVASRCRQAREREGNEAQGDVGESTADFPWLVFLFSFICIFVMSCMACRCPGTSG
jgi:hypothetical protein